MISNDVETETQQSSGGAKLSQSITSWTSNLLATGLVIVVVLAFGNQFASSWFPSDATDDTFNLNQAWPMLESCSLQFGDAPYQFKRTTFTGEFKSVSPFLQNQCLYEMQNQPTPVGIIGRHEAELINTAKDQTPIEQSPGLWRLFKGNQLNEFMGIPMVYGIRDNCSGDEASRVVAWAMAIPGSTEKSWTTFVAIAAPQDAFSRDNEIFPSESSQSLAISDSKGGSIIGFKGGEISTAIAYYKELAITRDWKIQVDENQTKIWSASLSPNPENKIEHIQVQLDQTQDELQGFLVIQSHSGSDDSFNHGTTR